jgi:hypothetical protein
MGRKYKVIFSAVAVAAAQDLFEIKGAAGKMVRILRCFCGATDTTLVTAQSLSTRCRYLPATVTDGSGGTTPSFLPMDPGDAAASATALANNTTKATTNGTAVILGSRGDHIYQGVEYNFRATPFSEPPVIGPSEAFVFELLSTVSGTVHLSGELEIEEVGG